MCRVPAGDAVSRRAAALPRQEGGDGRCCVLAGAAPTHRLAGTVRSEQPCCNISNELGRLSCGSAGVGDVRGVYEVLRVPAGQRWSGAGGAVLWGCCCSTQGSGRARGWCSPSGQRDGAGLQGNERLGSDHPNWELPPPPERSHSHLQVSFVLSAVEM